MALFERIKSGALRNSEKEPAATVATVATHGWGVAGVAGVATVAVAIALLSIKSDSRVTSSTLVASG